MPGELGLELRPAARVLAPILDPSCRNRVILGDPLHTFIPDPFGHGLGLSLKLLPYLGRGPVPAPASRQRQSTMRVLESEVHGREPTHRDADNVGLLDT